MSLGQLPASSLIDLAHTLHPGQQPPTQRPSTEDINGRRVLTVPPVFASLWHRSELRQDENRGGSTIDSFLRTTSPEFKSLSQEMISNKNTKQCIVDHIRRGRSLVVVDASSPISASPSCHHISDTSLPRQQSAEFFTEGQLTERTNRQKSQDGQLQGVIATAEIDDASRHPSLATPSSLGSLWARNDVVPRQLLFSPSWIPTEVQTANHENTESLSTIRANCNARRAATEHIRGQSWADPSDTGSV